MNLKVYMFLKMQKYIAPELPKNISVSKMREGIIKLNEKTSHEAIPFKNIKDTIINFNSGSIPIRIYSPANGRNFPIIVYIHGGGWIGGNINVYDNVCRKLSKLSEAIVISVEYPLAPENPFPNGLNQIYNVIKWSYDNAKNINGKKDKIAIVGDSSGGNLCAAVSYMDKENSFQYVKCQVLIYPSTNILNLDTNSWIKFGKGYMMDKESQDKVISLYIKNKKYRRNKYSSPLLAEDFRNLPPTFIIVGELDPLKDEGVMYANKLIKSCVPTSLKQYKGVIHGFITMDRVFEQADIAIKEISIYIKDRFTYDI